MHELDAALVVNPYDNEATAAAMACALEMPIEERKERWNLLMDRLRANTVDDWCRGYLSTLCEERLVAPLGCVGRGRDAPRNQVAHVSG
jgi:trehalose 6-phosphate synthase